MGWDGTGCDVSHVSCHSRLIYRDTKHACDEMHAAVSHDGMGCDAMRCTVFIRDAVLIGAHERTHVMGWDVVRCDVM